MDVDDGMSTFSIVFLRDLTYFSDAPAPATSLGHTVCLPYHLVPGMDIHSRLFHKAVATIAKQIIAPAQAPTPEPAQARPPTVAEVRACRERVFDLHHGTSLFLFLTGYVLKVFPFS